jgi:Sec-independent protein translocase protein TatA
MQLLEFVYYYPPSELAPGDITGITTDQYEMVNITFKISLTDVSVFSGLEWLLGWTGNINLTPEAFTSWYQANEAAIMSSASSEILTQFYNLMIKPVGNYPNQEAATAAYVLQNGWEWLPYSEYVGLKGKIWNFVFSSLPPTNLYALVNPNYNPNVGIPSIAASIPWYVYAILIIGGIILLVSGMYRLGFFGAGQQIASTVRTVKETPGRKTKEEKESQKAVLEAKKLEAEASKLKAQKEIEKMKKK